MPTQHSHLVTQNQQLDVLRRLATTTGHNESQQYPEDRIGDAEQHLDDHAGAQQIQAGRGI
jgi:hypothetical protein